MPDAHVPLFPEALILSLHGSVRGGRLPIDSWDAVLDRIETLPLLAVWKSDLTASEQRGSAPHVVTSSRKSKDWQDNLQKRGLSRARRLAAADRLAQVAVIALTEIESWHHRTSWTYHLNVGFSADVDSGVFLDRWGGLHLEMTARSCQDEAPRQWVDVLIGFMLEVAPLIGGVYGSLGWRNQSEYLDPHGYQVTRYGDLEAPVVMPGATWVSLMPPGVVSAMGGFETVARDAPAHRVEPVRFHDGTTGALVQVTASASNFDDDAKATWSRYLAPTLRPQ